MLKQNIVDVKLPTICETAGTYIKSCKERGVPISDALSSEMRPQAMRDWAAFTPGGYHFDRIRYAYCMEQIALAWCLDAWLTEPDPAVKG